MQKSYSIRVIYKDMDAFPIHITGCASEEAALAEAERGWGPARFWVEAVYNEETGEMTEDRVLNPVD